MTLYAVQTFANRESTTAEMIIDREHEEIHATLAPDNIVSYIIVEADNMGAVQQVIEDIPHARKVLESGPVTFAEIEKYLTPTNDVEGVEEGSIVEITSGPFKSEKAQVQKIDQANERVTVEIIEATVPIPVEIRGDQIRVLDNKKEDDKDDYSELSKYNEENEDEETEEMQSFTSYSN